ncbi:hypothetical protein KTO58_05740 [Chitinophaga pendula]|uniref:hypothetical protein n=1 Tax=Chitinophaga TaxID=79328 RepID=UPI000BAEA4FF|nr:MULTISPECIES: hypothetical protein [Chitinophaga]ASZ13696.1 hypothetical protein CK934_23430 [Chitinophaga sp. MD30]UCJ08688.1 hypothetical protein KTO58_05740 [Chitinophaga pendula]
MQEKEFQIGEEVKIKQIAKSAVIHSFAYYGPGGLIYTEEKSNFVLCQWAEWADQGIFKSGVFHLNEIKKVSQQ